ncbi:hypothetical protein, partial [Candidatus Electronema sp. TJ]|uniref:hypothetical protein n=1 Tax=Candidatus Electronema sp. TJ TaxID=3401573 RepID=UPI003AA86124
DDDPYERQSPRVASSAKGESTSFLGRKNMAVTQTCGRANFYEGKCAGFVHGFKIILNLS